MPAVNYFWDGDNLLQEYDDAGNTFAHYVTEPQPYGNVVSQRRDGESHHFHYDGLGSTMELTDEVGDVTDARRYSAFGQTIEDSGSTEFPFQFVGRLGYYYDFEILCYYVRRRMYGPFWCEWISVDPSSSTSRGGFAADVNGYVYVNNNPINALDPSGLLGIDVRFEGCSYYTSNCRCIRWANLCQRIYYCFAAKFICWGAGNGPWRDCVRTCLQCRDAGLGQYHAIENHNPIFALLGGCTVHLGTEAIDHAVCFVACRINTESHKGGRCPE